MLSASKVSLEQFFDYCRKYHLPLAIYRLPNEKKVKIIAQKTSVIKKFSDHTAQKGFLFAPFKEDKTFKKIFIKPDIFCEADKLPDLNFSISPLTTTNKIVEKKQKEVTKTEFLKYLKNIKHEIRKNTFKKVVAARIVKKKIPANFNAVQFLKLLCKEYSNAFVSLVYTEDYGLWIGASPEIFLTTDKNEFKTNSLAGTKKNTALNKKTNWGNKETDEQKIVSDYIQNIFSKFTKENPQIDGPKTISAANLLHLRTTFIYKSIPFTKWEKVVQQLHPTPAVAGLPKLSSINFILKNEPQSRGFYSGYMGPVNLDNKINLFVNLRCMNVLGDSLIVYVGCGITADSKLEDEWIETKIKSETLLGLL